MANITREDVMKITNYDELFHACQTEDEVYWVEAERVKKNNDKNGKPRTVRFETVRNAFFKEFYKVNVRNYETVKVDKYADAAAKRIAELKAKK